MHNLTVKLHERWLRNAKTLEWGSKTVWMKLERKKERMTEGSERESEREREQEWLKKYRLVS
jgi:hypothetical protein